MRISAIDSDAVHDPASDWASRPSSTSIRSISSTKSGLPSAAVRILEALSAGSAAPPGSSTISRAVASDPKGSSRTVVTFSLPPPQVGRALEEVGTGRAEQQEGRIAAPVSYVLDEVEECRLSPVDVLDHDHEWALSGDVFEQLADRPEDLLLGGCFQRQPDRARDPGRHDVRITLSFELRA